MEENKNLDVKETEAVEKKTVKKAADKADAAVKEKKSSTKKIEEKETAEKKPAAKKPVVKKEEIKEDKPVAKKTAAKKEEAVVETAINATESEEDKKEVKAQEGYKPREGFKPREGYQPRPKTYAGFQRRPRRRVCPFCANNVEEIDYIKLAIEIRKSAEPNRDGDRRPRYITEKGRILPRRMSGVCVKHQRLLATAIKRARIMALLPFQAD